MQPLLLGVFIIAIPAQLFPIKESSPSWRVAIAAEFCVHSSTAALPA
jgi:hypothetical protein